MTGTPAKSLGKPPRDRIVQNGRILSGIKQEVPVRCETQTEARHGCRNVPSEAVRRRGVPAGAGQDATIGAWGLTGRRAVGYVIANSHRISRIWAPPSDPPRRLRPRGMRSPMSMLSSTRCWRGHGGRWHPAAPLRAEADANETVKGMGK